MSSLVVDTNLSAMAANNALNATDSQMTKAITELSTGLSIQTAADGPAAYVQSQALQSQANGYQVAISNAQDGVSLVQTASGALNQISSILQTMNQLALSSANGATQDSTSLHANQQEFQALQNDINQIAATTSYGTTNLLNGSFSNQTLQVGAFDVSTQQINLAISAADANSLGVGSTGGAGASVQAVVGDQNLVFASGATSVSLTAAELMTVTEGNVTALVTVASGVTLTQAQFAATIDSQLSAIGIAATITSAGSLELYSTSGTAFSAVDSGATFIGTTAVAATAVTIATGVSVDTQSNAQAAISAVQSAISMVDSIEASVGAVQNQLQAIAANLTVGQQNLTAANSQLVDVNMAQEMTTFSTDQILMQTGTSMLAQAQQAPQLVLKLI